MRRFLLLLCVLLGCGLLPDWFAAPTPEPYFEAACAFQWATQPLLEISDELTAAMAQANVSGVTISASAYGENCINADGSVRSFSAMETDYALTVPAGQLADALAVLIKETADGRAGANPERITLEVRSNGDSIPLQLAFKSASEAVAQGLRGEALITALKSS